MEFLHRTNPAAHSIALLPAAWNPPTRAHLAMLRAAQEWAAEAVLVLPRALPHKTFEGAHFTRRSRWIRAIAESHGFSAGISEGGLFIEMARECRVAADATEIYLVCGRDAAERIVGWDYGAGESIDTQLEEYQLLVAPRCGDYLPSPIHHTRIHSLNVGGDWHDISSSEVRRRLQAGDAWADLVPQEIAADVRTAYQAEG